MEQQQRTAVDVIGRRLMWIGLAAAAVIGVIWWKESGDVTGYGESFDGTPYAVALAVAVAVAVLGLVLQVNRSRD